jgi:hypothetical protein
MLVLSSSLLCSYATLAARRPLGKWVTGLLNPAVVLDHVVLWDVASYVAGEVSIVLMHSVFFPRGYRLVDFYCIQVCASNMLMLYMFMSEVGGEKSRDFMEVKL